MKAGFHNPPTLPSLCQGRAAPGTTLGVEQLCLPNRPTGPAPSTKAIQGLAELFFSIGLSLNPCWLALASNTAAWPLQPPPPFQALMQHLSTRHAGPESFSCSDRPRKLFCRLSKLPFGTFKGLAAASITAAVQAQQAFL